MPFALLRLLLGSGVLLVLGGCSGTPFGDQLARSFSNPTAPATGTQPRAKATPAAPAPPAAPGPNQSAPAAERPAVPAAKAPAVVKPIPTAKSLQPAPYRVTIKLPSADPSAPAEVVTQALRAAGVSFEVEMIERVRGNGPTTAPAAPVVTPAPAPR